MSTLLYRLGRFVTRRPRGVLAAWGILVLILVTTAGLFQEGTDDRLEIPGAESTVALEHLKQVFPELAGSSVVFVVEQRDETPVDNPAVRAAVADTLERLRTLDHVIYLDDPFDPAVSGKLSPDGRLAVVSAYLDVDALNVTPEIKKSLAEVRNNLQVAVGDGATVHMGGDALGTTVPTVTPMEMIGLILAFVILLVTLGSLIAAGMPMLLAVVGAILTMSGIYLSTTFTQIMSSTPVLALMLGLAVSIDYALFVLARHREQLAGGMSDIPESIARSVATAGSAVVVAGATVAIALLGLFVAGMPFLTTMGLAASFGIGVAVLLALTALPALMTLAGERLRPRRTGAPSPDGTSRLARRWVSVTTTRPLVTILVVVGGLLLCAVPAKDLRLSLPDAGSLEEHNPARITHELLAEHFGDGYNSPLLLMIDVLPTTDPIGVTNEIAEEVAEIPGVASVPLSTPNRTGDTSIIVVTPTGAVDSPETAALVERLLEFRSHIEEHYGLHASLTGLTAITIDVSHDLAWALLPFALFVVGLSVLLLTAVFRSVAIPLIAALGYLLSVGAAFGITSVVWMYGWFADTLNVQHVGSVMAFLPIIAMGVLFGLAMDYQLFLVSRVYEHYLRQGDAQAAIARGLSSSSRVVVAAAAIMLGVFAFFVPDGTADTKPVAFALAVGVFIDAFLIRMTLVPATLALLGERAWWLPTWLDRRLPRLDTEGESLTQAVRLNEERSLVLTSEQAGARPGREPTILARGLRVFDDTGLAVVDSTGLRIDPGTTVLLSGPSAPALLLALSGRATSIEGDLLVDGRILPSQRRALRRSIVLVVGDEPNAPATALQALRRGVPLVLVHDVGVAGVENWAEFAEQIRHGDRLQLWESVLVLESRSEDVIRSWRRALPFGHEVRSEPSPHHSRSPESGPDAGHPAQEVLT
jgi:RND superfamily putative drug exporter